MRFALAGALALATALPAPAQDSPWSGSVTAYGWFPALSGNIAIPGSGLSTDFSQSIGDILSQLDFAFSGQGELWYMQRFGVSADLVYSQLSDATTLPGPAGVRIRHAVESTMVTVVGLYRAYSDDTVFVDLLAGGRYVSNDLTLTELSPGSRSASRGDDFLDPIIGVRGGVKLTDRWSLGGLIDIGGFGAGSDFALEVVASARYAITPTITADVGFRYLSFDREGSGTTYDLQQFGPVAGLTLRF